MDLYDVFTFTVADSDNDTTRRLRLFRRKYCLRMEYEDKENSRGNRFVQGSFRLRNPMTMVEIRRLLGFPRLFLKAIGRETIPVEVVVVSPVDVNPLTQWMRLRPSISSVVGHFLRTAIKK